MRSSPILVTFADGDEGFIAAGKRLTKQARQLNCFGRIICLDSADLANLLPEYAFFASEADNLLDRYTLYQSAKPFVLKAGLTGMLGDFQQIVFLDAGCEIVVNPISRLKFVWALRRARKLPLGVVQATIYREENYTKKKTLEFFGCSGEISSSFQLQPGVIILNKNSASLSLIDLWIRHLDPKLDLVQDPVSREDKLVAHRRDQSIFSILWKQNHGGVFDFYWNTPRKKNRFLDAVTSTYAIQAIRNRTGDSMISSSPYPKFISLSIGILFLPLLKIHRFTKKHLSP